MTVLDASVVVDVLLGIGVQNRARQIMMLDAGGLAAPHLLDAEVGQVLRRWTLAGALTALRAHEALEDLAGLRILRYPHEPLLARAFALHRNVSFYDALYLALAEGLDAPLITKDGALGRLPRHRGRVQVLA